MFKRWNKYCFFLMMLFTTAGCSNPKTDYQSAKQSIINTDKAFSDMSREHGMKKAFIEYMDNEGILLRPDNLPIIGADAIDFLSQSNDTAFTLTWKPSAVEISASEDLGYTYGIYNLHTADTVLNGTYVSIWKKQSDGKWKFVLDSGNQGIKNEP